MASIEYTRFPNLSSFEAEGLSNARPSSRQLHGFRASPEHLYLAWAWLLRTHTAKEHVVFESDDAIIHVNTARWNVNNEKKFTSSTASKLHHTGVFFKSKSNGIGLSLRLYMLAESDSAILESSAYVPQPHLNEIEQQLRDAIASFSHNQTPPRTHSNHSNLSVINPNPRLIKDPTLLHHLIRQIGDSVALEFTSHNRQKTYLTYSELDNQSGSLARSICACGHLLEASSQPVIPLLIPQSQELYVTLLAVLKAGCAFCPLPFDAPPDRLRFVIGDMSARLVLTVSPMLEKLPRIDGVTIFCVDKLPNSTNKNSTSALRPVSPNNFAYVMYTSGSTGNPKGVPISHTAVTQSLLAHDRHIPQFSRFLQFAAPTFDVSMFEIFFTLYRGSTLVACQREDLLNDLPGIMRNLNVDAAELTPTVAGGLLKKRHLVPSLNILLTIGEMLTPQVVEEFGGDENQESILWAMYGPTEAAIHCTLQPAFKANFKVGNIGFPLDTVSTFVVSAHTETRENEEIEILPVGHVGELAVGGHQLAECYLNRPEQTAKAFINSKTYGRLYLTGDKARMLPDGTLECLGRISSGQVKLRGQRIELGEVEAAALKISACLGAAACVIHNTLVLFCHGDGDKISSEHVTDACRQWLPGYMVPGDVVIVQELPRLASGKVDRKLLEIQYQHFLDSLQTPSQLSDVLTLRVCDIVSSVVGRPVKPEDQLIASGLDSLLAIQAATRFRQNGLQISAGDVLNAITVNDLCASLESKESAEDHAFIHTGGSNDNFAEIKTWIFSSQGFGLRRTDIQEIIPCTPLQISMLAETTKDPRTYYNWIEFAFCQPHSFEEINEWITDLCTKNEILRSGFLELTQADCPFAQIIWNTLDSTQISKVHQFEKSTDISKQFTFARPIQFQVLCGKSESRLLIQLHHALYDGWSMDHICHDLTQISVGNKIQIRPQFREVVDFYHRLSGEESYSYWQEQLADFNPKALPSCNTQDLQADAKASNVRSMFIALPKLRHCARLMCVSPQAFFQAALACTLSSYLDATDIIFATVTSGRTLAIPRMEDVIGPCIATLPLRFNLSHAFRVRDLLSLVHDRNRAMIQHCTLSFREIKKACGFDARTSLSDVLFVWQETLQSRTGDEAEQCVRLVDQSDHLEFKLVLEIEPHGNDLLAKVTYQCETFTESEVDILLQRIDELVVKFEEDSNATLGSACHEVLPEPFFIGDPQPEFVTSSRDPAPTVDSHVFQSFDGNTIPVAKPIIQNRENARVVTNEQFNLKANEDVDESEDLSDGTEIEKKLSALFAGVVGISVTSIKRHASLFAFGLDSISAIPFSKLIRDHTLRNVTVSIVLQNPTIARLASKIKSSEPTRLPTGDPLKAFTYESIRRIKTRLGNRAEKLLKILPCTPLQEAMLSASHSNDSGVYCNLMEFKIHAGTQKLKQCWKQVVKRQEILRTCFVATEQADFPFAQVVLSENDGYWKEVFIESEETDCLSHAAQSNQRIMSYLDAIEPPYDLELVVSSRHTFFRFASHHALYDASAMARLLLEVEQLYNGIELPTPVSYEPFINMMISMRSNHALDFWCNKLDGFQPRLLTPSVSRRQISTAHQLAYSFSDIEAAARSHRVSLMILLQAAWVKVLQSIFNTDDVCFGNIFSGRTLPLENLHQLIAPTFNTLPVRLDLSRCSTNSALLNCLQKFNNDALDFQLVPLRAIQNRLRMSGTGLFSTLFLLQHSPYELDTQIWTLERDMGNMNFPITLELIPNKSHDTLYLNLHFEESLLSRQHAIEIKTGFTSALESCIRYPAAGVRDFSPVSESCISHLRQKIISTTVQTESHQPTVESSKLTLAQDELRNFMARFSGTPVQRVSPDMTIYQLGLDSVSVVQLVAMLNLEKGISVSAADILERPKLSELMILLEQQQDSEKRSDLNPKFDFESFETSCRSQICAELELGDVESVHPCTQVQIGLLAQFLQSKDDYINAMAYELDDGYDTSIVMKAWQVLASVHPTLRMGFVPIEHQEFSFAMITYQVHAKRPWIEIRQNKSDLETLRIESAMKFHAMISDPPWRVLLSRTPGGVYMQLVMFHGLYDAHSLHIIFSDLRTVLENASIPSPRSTDNLLEKILLSSILQTNLDAASSFWKTHLLGASSCRFPCLTPLRSSMCITAHLSKSCSVPLKELTAECKRLGITLQAAGQGAWAQLLSAYTGDLSVVFGTVLSGRDVATDADGIAFPTIVTLPIAVDTDKSTKEMLSAITNYNASARRYQFSSLSRIQRWVGHPNEVMFDTIFALQKLPDTTPQSAWKPTEEISTAEYAVSLELEYATEDRLNIRLTFQIDILPREQASIMLDQYDLMLRSMLFNSGDSNGLITEMGLSVLSTVPAKVPLLPSPAGLLHEFVELKARKLPNRIAFEFASKIDSFGVQSKSWTYADLDAAGNKIANLIFQHGGHAAGLVAICFDKCPEASFAILGILKSGCAYVAIDPSAPSDRKAFILRDSKAILVLTFGKSFHGDDSSSECHTKFGGIPIIQLDKSDWNKLPALKPLLKSPVQPEDLCYCLYTSGTTGTPKGCLITHQNAVQAMRAFSKLFAGHWNEDSRWLQFASFHFDVSVLEQYWSWSEGIQVVSAPRDIILRDLSETIRALQVTHIDLTPSLATLLNPELVPSLCKGVFITGGEKLRQEILDVWGPKAVIYNGYGPTEATIGVTMFPRVPSNGRPSNIGPPFDNVGAHILRPGLDEPVLRGAVGELCVSGALVGRGYLNRPDLTGEKFPYLNSLGERVYRTGDLVRMLHDGSIDFIGRTDDQIKLRGQRLEIGEINNVIRMGTSAIAEVATFVLKHPKQQKEQLVTFLAEFKSTSSSSTVEILYSQPTMIFSKEAAAACRAKLPTYMVPTHYIAVNCLPLTANNKVDVKSLQRSYYELTQDDIRRLYCTERSRVDLSETEQRIVKSLERFAEIQKADIHPDANLFELGLDSISVIGLARVLKAAGFSGAQPSVIMKNATISALASTLKSRSPDSIAAESTAILASKQAIAASSHRHRPTVTKILGVIQEEVEAITLCTPLQHGIISRSLDPERRLYFNAFQLRINNSVSLDKLKEAWVELYHNASILRTRFVRTDHGYLQVVLRRPVFPWYEIETDDQSLQQYLEHRKVVWQSKNELHLREPFELLLVKTTTMKLLVLHLFHALYDGNSLQLLFSIVANLYQDVRNVDYGPQFYSVLPYGPLQEVKGAEAFWNEHITIRHPISVSLSVKRITTSSGDVRVLTCLPVQKDIEAVRKKLGVTHQAIVQSCWISILRQYVSNSISIGIVVSGRNTNFEGADRVIGPLFNTIPFQIHVESNDTWETVIKRCHSFNVAALSFQHTPLRDIHKWLKFPPQRQLFDSLFVFQKQTPETAMAHSDRLWEHLDDHSPLDHSLALEVEHCKDGSFKLTLAAQGHFFDERDIRKMLTQFGEALDVMLANPKSRISATVEIPNYAEGSTPKDSENEEPAQRSAPFQFNWIPEAIYLRSEIAKLADISESEINHCTSLFELGLDSIDAIKLTSRLQKVGIAISISTLMRKPTIASIMENASAGRNQVTEPRRSDLTETEQRIRSHLANTEHSIGNAERILPCTPLQEAMLARMIHSGFEQYYTHDVLQLRPGTSIMQLKNAWQQAYNSIPIVRTAFVPVDDPAYDGAFAQVVLRPGAIPWKTIKLSDLNKVGDLLVSTSRDAANFPFKESKVRLTHVELPNSDLLVLSMPHAMYDGWSIGLLHNFVAEAYTHHKLTTPTADSVLEEILSASSFEATEFWRNYLSGAKPSLLAEAQKKDSVVESVIHRKEQASKLSVNSLRSFCKHQGVTLQALGQLCWSLVLASYLGQLEVVFGVVLSGRETEQAQKVLFPTMNTVVFRSIIHGLRGDMLRYTQDDISSIRQYQQFPLRKAQRHATTTGGKLFDSIFIHQVRPTSLAGELILYDSVGGDASVEYPVCVEIEVLGSDFVWRVACDNIVFDEEETAQLVVNLDTILQDLVNEPEADIFCFEGNKLRFSSLPPCDYRAQQHIFPENSLLKSNSDFTSTERIIRFALSVVSKVPEEEIDRVSTIFNIGLDSISAIKVSALLRKHSISLSVGEMLSAATIQGMAKLVDGRKNDVKQSDILRANVSSFKYDSSELCATLGLIDSQIEDVMPATAGQIYMLSSWQNSHGFLFYPTFKYLVHGVASLEKLHQAWQQLVRANPILRTVFVANQSTKFPILQVVLHIPRDGFSEGTDSQNMERQQPLVALFASRAGEGTFSLELKIHHALYDAVALAKLMLQFQKLLRGNSRMLESSPQVNPFKDVVQRSYASGTISQAKAFWIKYLKGTERIPKLQQPPAATFERVELFKPGLINNIKALERLARKSSVSVVALFLTIYARIYSHLVITRTTSSNVPSNESENEVVIGIYLANRSHVIEELENVATPTLNLVPLRVRISDPVVDCAKRIQHDLVEIARFENATTGLWQIEQWTGVKVDTFVNFLNLPEDGEYGSSEHFHGNDGEDENIRVVCLDEERIEQRTRIMRFEVDGFEEQVELRKSAVKEAYLHSIDVEAAIRNGKLDVGLFGSTTMFPLDGAEKVMAEMRENILALVK